MKYFVLVILWIWFVDVSIVFDVYLKFDFFCCNNFTYFAVMGFTIFYVFSSYNLKCCTLSTCDFIFLFLSFFILLCFDLFCFPYFSVSCVIFYCYSTGFLLWNYVMRKLLCLQLFVDKLVCFWGVWCVYHVWHVCCSLM